MSKLAINGGKKVVPKGHIEWPPVTQREREAINRVIDKKIFWGADAPEVSALEKEWSEFVGSKYCIATNSGTAALHIAVKGSGVQAGDEVITTALTFVASALAIFHANAIPVFVDIDPKTYNIDPKKIEAKITDKTKAIIPVHLHGLPADMDEINAIAKKNNLAVIEDACQAHGAIYKGQRAGTLGDLAGFSLNGSKNLPGCEGGLFVTSNKEFYEEAKKVRDLGEIIEPGVERDYNAFEIGWMYRYTEMPAAFTRVRLQSLDEENKKRGENADYLSKYLGKFKGITTPFIPGDRTCVYHLYRLRFDPKELGLDISANEFRAKVQKALRAEGVQANRWQNRPVPMQALFQNRNGYGYGCPWTCPFGKGSEVKYREEEYIETKKLVEDSIVFHSAIYPPNGKELMDQYIEAFQKLWDNLDEVMGVTFNPGEIYIRE
jgi:perosamine synthetase